MPRPNKMGAQLRQASAELRKSPKARIQSTFFLPSTQYDLIPRKFQKCRMPLERAFLLLKSSDLLLRSLAAERIKYAPKKQLRRFLPLLKELEKNRNGFLRNVGYDALEKLRGERKWKSKEEPEKRAKPLLLSERKPFLASPHLPELMKRLAKIDTVSRKLKKEFGSDFVGILVFGSTTKGYAGKKSDIDCLLVAKAENEMVDKFELFLKKQKLSNIVDTDHVIFPEYLNPGFDMLQIANIFHGFFFGDKKALSELQKRVFSEMNESQWEKVREIIFRREASVDHPEKVFERMGIKSEREKQRITASAALRVPPPYKEMKKLLGL